MYIIKNLDNGMLYAGLNEWTTSIRGAMNFPTAELADKALAKIKAENQNEKFSVYKV